MDSPRPAPEPWGVPLEVESAVAALFGSESVVARAFAVHLGTSAVERGLIGPREVPRLWDRHVLNCAAIAPLIPEASVVVDVGSGAGLPGVVLAIARPDLRLTLVEPLQRRVVWLEEIVEQLGLTNIEIVRGRAEHLRDRRFDVSTARAVAGLETLAEWLLPLVRPGGLMIAIKGQSAHEELRSSEVTLKRLGARSWRVEVCGEAILAVPTTAVVVEVGDPPRSPQKRSRRSVGGNARAGGQAH